MSGGEPVKVLVAGVARSGTTWFSRVLAADPDAAFVNEPDNNTQDPFAYAGKEGLGLLPSLVPGERAPTYGLMWDVAFRGGWPTNLRPVRDRCMRLPKRLARAGLITAAHLASMIPARASHVVVKTIFAPFSVEWIAARVRARVVVIQRHPLNVLASWDELGIPPYEAMLESRIWNRWLEPIGVPPPHPAASLVARRMWSIAAMEAALKTAASRHADWAVVRHESLSADPQGSYRRLFAQLGLPWSDAVDRVVPVPAHEGRAATREEWYRLSESWRRRLSDGQVEDALAVLAVFPDSIRPVT